jgi:hypothetical protein
VAVLVSQAEWLLLAVGLLLGLTVGSFCRLVA